MIDIRNSILNLTNRLRRNTNQHIYKYLFRVIDSKHKNFQLENSHRVCVYLTVYSFGLVFWRAWRGALVVWFSVFVNLHNFWLIELFFVFWSFLCIKIFIFNNFSLSLRSRLFSRFLGANSRFRCIKTTSWTRGWVRFFLEFIWIQRIKRDEPLSYYFWYYKRSMEQLLWRTWDE